MSAEAEKRTLARIGFVFTLILVAACFMSLINPFARHSANRISVAIDTPYIGQGVSSGTPVIINGVKVGDVTLVSSIPGGGVRVDADLQSAFATGLTDTLSIDFRPINYFGVTGINLVPGIGGRPLQHGSRINTVPHGNFTLQTLLSRMGDITDGVVTSQLIQVVDKVTRYTDGLNPLIETMLYATKAVAEVQTVSTEQLLRNATGVSTAFPSFTAAATQLGSDFIDGGLVFFEHTGEYVTEDFWTNRYTASIELASTGLFSAIGNLETSHIDELLPAVELVKTLSDVAPALVRPESIADTLVQLRTRFEKMYEGSPEQRALQVHIVLDSLPGIAAPIAAIGGP